MEMTYNKRQEEWMKQNTTRVVIKLNHRTDADIIRYLDRQPSKMGAIKAAIRAQMEKEEG